MNKLIGLAVLMVAISPLGVSAAEHTPQDDSNLAAVAMSGEPSIDGCRQDAGEDVTHARADA